MKNQLWIEKPLPWLLLFVLLFSGFQKGISEFNTLSSIAYTVGEAPGVDTNYLSLEISSYPVFKKDIWQPLFVAASHFLKDGNIASNVGLGARLFHPISSITYGMNCFYDLRTTDIGIFHQFGLGIEALSPYYAFRLNGYIPIFKHSHIGPLCTYDDYIGDYLANYREKEYSFAKLDCEIEKYFYLRDCLLFSTSFRSYFLKTADSSTMGVGTRISLSWLNHLSSDFIYSYDHIFGGKMQGQLRFQIPLYSMKNCSWDCRQSKNPWIRRQQIIPINSFCRYTTNY